MTNPLYTYVRDRSPLASTHRMRFIMTPVGSSGDVHPFIGIGRALKARGHEVAVISAEPFADLARRAGLLFHQGASTEEFDAVTKNPDLWHPRRGLQIVLHEVATRLRSGYRCVEELYEPGRTVLVGHALSFFTRVFQEVHGAPAATLELAPSIFRSNYAQPAFVPGRDASGWPAWLRQSVWWAVDTLLIDPAIAPVLNTWRRELGLPPVRHVLRDWLHSPMRIIGLFPDWFAPPQPDWPAALRLTGFPLFDDPDAAALPDPLARFLESGSPPIVFTPGSANQTAERFFEAGLDASARLGRRVLLLTRYPRQLPPLPPTAHHEPFVPLSALLPRCAALVSHGGIGTIAQGLAAGIPQVTMPMGFDQPDNATRLRRIGVGRWVLPSAFDGPRVASTLAELLGDPEVERSCRRWADAISGRRAIEETCDLLEQLA